MYTVWRFKSVDGKQVVVVVHAAEPDDLYVQSEYQRVLWRGIAPSKKTAFAQYEQSLH